MLPVRKILCPTDFSEPSLSGVAAADELAAHFKAELLLVTVVTPIHPTGGPRIPESSELHRDLVDYATEALAKIAAERITPGVRMRQFVAHGNAADEIAALARDHAVDLLVIATHGWTGWRRLMFGSVTHKVIRMVACPVLTITGPAAD